MDILVVILCLAIGYHIIFQERREIARGILLARIAQTLDEIAEGNDGARGYHEEIAGEMKHVGRYLDKLEKAEREHYWGHSED